MKEGSMTDYNFETLNDKEFEELVNDLLSNKFNTLVERFKPGKDQGVDGRFFRPDGKEVIIQSKHYLNSGYNPLLRHCKSIEAKKVKNLAPARYIFATSVPMSRVQKQELSKVFEPYLKEDDIYSKETINDLLKEYPNVEKNHYKLWLSSTNVLETLLHSEIDFDTENEVDAIKSTLSKYVKTSLHDKAQNKLKRDNCLVILGNPGVGKTTLARMLCHEYMSSEDKYELVFIESDLKDANKKYKQDKYQVYYFDDFLGSNYLDAISDSSDSRISKFMRRIANDSKKKFILTSRVSIFNQGVSCSEVLNRSKLHDNKFLIHTNELTNLDKAKILYNHMYFARTPEHQYYDHISNIIDNNRHYQIIRHPNYSPRIIEFILNQTNLREVPVEDYWDYIMSSLDNPKQIWEHQIKNQISDLERKILWFVTLSRNIEDEALNNLVSRFCDLNDDVYSYHHALKQLDGALISRFRHFNKDNIHIRLHNPSIADYIIPTLISNNVEFLSCMIVNLGDFFKPNIIPRHRPREDKGELEIKLWSSVADLITNTELTPSCFHLGLVALDRLIYKKPSNYSSNNKRYEKQMILFEKNVYINKYAKTFNDLVDYYNKGSIRDNDLATLERFYAISSILSAHNKIQWFDIFDNVFNNSPDHDDLIEVSKILDNLSDIEDYFNIKEEFSECVTSYWPSEIGDRVDSDFDDSVLISGYSSIYEEGMSEEDLDEEECLDAVENAIREIINDVIDEYYINLSVTEDLITNIDIDDFTQRAIFELSSKIEESNEPIKKIAKPKLKAKKLRARVLSTECDAIDDLFSKT